MNSLMLSQVGLFVHQQLFQNLTLSIGERDRVGLVAGNGGGKTTLLRCIAGFAEPTSGRITQTRGMKLAYVEQDVPKDLLGLSFYDAVASGLSDHEKMNELWRVDVALNIFEVPPSLWEQSVRTLSGGWQRFMLLARAWVSDPDGLLLDEPTNHLDLEKIRFLEKLLAEASGRMPMLIFSHDRSFLDACTTHTLFLRPEVSKVYAHPFSKARQLLREDDDADAVQLARDMKEAERLRQSSRELRNIGINSGSDTFQKKSKQMRERAENMEQAFKALHKERSGDIRLRSSETHAKTLVSLDDVPICRPDGTVLFRTGKLRIHQGDRIVILGANGAGKSQFIRLLRSAVQDQEEMPGVRCAPSLVLGYADQLMTQLPDQETPFGYITSRFSLGDQRSRSLLAGTGFPVAQQDKLIGAFSLGQKARLGMLALRLTQPNFYLLDEPTNHVDIAGQEKLESEILAQKATCVLVSHDRSFVSAVGTRFLEIRRSHLIEGSAFC